MSSEIENLMAFYAGGRSAQTCPLVHICSPTYEWDICSAIYRRNISSTVDVSRNINTALSLLPNCRKLFPWVFTFSVTGDQKWERTQKRHFVGFA